MQAYQLASNQCCCLTRLIKPFIETLVSCSHFLKTFPGARKLFGGYKITPKFCTDAKTSKADAKVHGPAICMFNHECVERRGVVIGACMDG